MYTEIRKPKCSIDFKNPYGALTKVSKTLRQNQMSSQAEEFEERLWYCATTEEFHDLIRLYVIPIT